MMIDPTSALDVWINALKDYSLEALQRKPSPDSWSLGQLYNHLIGDTTFYLEQAIVAAASDDYQNETKIAVARSMFANNSFPAEQLKGDPSNDNIRQPSSKTELFEQVTQLRTQIKKVYTQIATRNSTGKSLHPGFGYFSAEEWMQFADMHFRHHLRQKNRIDSFLTSQRMQSRS